MLSQASRSESQSNVEVTRSVSRTKQKKTPVGATCMLTPSEVQASSATFRSCCQSTQTNQLRQKTSHPLRLVRSLVQTTSYSQTLAMASATTDGCPLFGRSLTALKSLRFGTPPPIRFALVLRRRGIPTDKFFFLFTLRSYYVRLGNTYLFTLTM